MLAAEVQELGVYLAMDQNLRYLFSRDYHLFKRLFKGHRGTGFRPTPIWCCFVFFPLAFVNMTFASPVFGDLFIVVV